jgi:hypothetical protein
MTCTIRPAGESRMTLCSPKLRWLAVKKMTRQISHSTFAEIMSALIYRR